MENNFEQGQGSQRAVVSVMMMMMVLMTKFSSPTNMLSLIMFCQFTLSFQPR
jgi:hypothetical protein